MEQGLGWSPSEKSTGLSGLRALDSDIDLIPSLSLPPPMMPHRVYGHNYLDKQCLVQVTIGGTNNSTSSSSTSGPSSKSTPAVRLHPRLLGSSSLGMSLGLDIPNPTPLSSPIFKPLSRSRSTTCTYRRFRRPWRRWRGSALSFRCIRIRDEDGGEGSRAAKLVWERREGEKREVCVATFGSSVACYWGGCLRLDSPLSRPGFFFRTSEC